MKNLIWGLLLTAGAMVFFVACEQETLLSDDAELIQAIADSEKTNLTAAEIPSAISSYVTENYSPLIIESAYRAADLGYEIVLDNAYTIYFDENLAFRGPHPDGCDRPSRCLRGDTIDLTELPQAVYDYVAENYAEESIVMVVLKEDGKYAVELSDGTALIFDAEGVFVVVCGEWAGPGGPQHGRDCMRGDTIDLSELPQAVYDYVAANYPEASIVTAVLKPDGQYAVKLSDNKALIFDAEGVFVSVCGEMDGPGHHGDCNLGQSVDIADLPQAISAYVAANYPGLSIVSAVEKRHDDYGVELSDGTVLIFDEDGTFLRICED
ncbi:MAG TPA: PepSY-like domain-containing protein [Saprospiraceae bacterium]|nr:PepSY-like domain-containing protein [Saprospiraceae bacterium]HMQ84404.1 PepSY-like domain-containing protein [Saprospiraceae bacterium]